MHAQHTEASRYHAGGLKAAASRRRRAAWEAEKAEAKQERAAPARPSSTRRLPTGRPQRAPAFPPSN